jgi:hypothetical protein
MRSSHCLALDIARKNSKRNAIAAASAGAFFGRRARLICEAPKSANIFNGFLLAPIKEKIPALNSI